MSAHNFNDEATVKLTDIGIKVLLRYFGNAYLDTCHHGWRSGAVSMPLWEIAQVFGPGMGNGMPLLMETAFELRANS